MSMQLTDGEISEWRAQCSQMLAKIARSERDASQVAVNVPYLRAIRYMLLLHDAIEEIGQLTSEGYSFESQVSEILGELIRKFYSLKSPPSKRQQAGCCEHLTETPSGRVC